MRECEQREQRERMDRWFVDPLFHLQFAKGVFRAPNLSGRILHFADQSPSISLTTRTISEPLRTSDVVKQRVFGASSKRQFGFFRTLF